MGHHRPPARPRLRRRQRRAALGLTRSEAQGLQGGILISSPALVIGEALIDLIVRPDLPSHPVVGGSPLNVAVGLSRLGVPALLHTHIGTDRYGAMIEQHLASNDVRLVTGSIRPGATSVARATIGGDGAARYAFDISWAPVPVAAWPVDPVLVHVGSIGAVVEPGGQVVSDVLGLLRASATISYDPNVRPALMGDAASARDRIERLVAAADVVKASDEDVAWLYPGSDPAEVARHWQDLGPALVVVTRGELGAFAVARDAAVDVPAPAVEVVDTIGAGDSFMAGLQAALADHGLLGRGREAALRAVDEATVRRIVGFAAACAAVTVSRVGANPPVRDQVGSSVGVR